MTPLPQRTNTVITKIINNKSQIATDLTRKFHLTSKRRNKYLFVIHKYNSNSILIHPIKDRSDSKFILVFKGLHDHLLTKGLNPAYMTLDKWSLSRFPNRTQVQGHQLPTITPRNAYPQRGWMCNNYIQGSLHCRDLLNIPRLAHEKLGSYFRTDGD